MYSVKSFTNREIYYLIALNLVWRLYVLESSYQERTDYIQTSAKEKDFNLSSHKYPKFVCSISKKLLNFMGLYWGKSCIPRLFLQKILFEMSEEYFDLCVMICQIRKCHVMQTAKERIAVTL